ncbi:MAG TPA: YaiI/YqxD family protein [Rhizomicrobium sp.]|nr:YaiI/YqxD family protein [Rhizomicrobium sp.]
MMEIYVDADACPVKAEVEKVATRHGLKMYVVSNGGIRPRPNPLIETVIVSEGADIADDWIAGHIQSGDIAITSDILLAGRCLEKGARVLRPNGSVFTPDNIGVAKGMREFQRHLREVTGGQTYNAGFTQKDRSQFLNALENTIQTLKRLK